jgi:hypothetical protein
MSTVLSVAPAPPPETVTLLFVFDVGRSYLTPPGFDWAKVHAVKVADSPWSRDNGFPSDIRPPLRDPISRDWDLEDAELKAAMADLPWCELESARFVFFLEGLAALRVRGRLRDTAETCMTAFHDWDNSAHNYDRFTVLAQRAGQDFGRLAEKARLLPVFQEWREPGVFHWIYPIFFVPAAPRLYATEASLQPAITLGGSRLEFAWLGAQVSPPGADVQEAEAAFLAAALAWQSLHTLDRLLTRYFETLTLQQTDEDARLEQRIIKIQSLQIFSVHLLDASRPLRWTIRGRVLTVLKALDNGWDTRELRESVGAQNGLAGLLTLYYDKLETKRRESARWFFQLAAGVLTLLTLFTTIGAVIDLYDPDKTQFKGPRRAVEALMFFIPIIAVGFLEWLLWRGATSWKEESRPRCGLPARWLLAVAVAVLGALGAWALGNWLWTWLPI